MRKKLTAKQKYNRDYYLSHKDEKAFKERRNRNSKVYRSTARFKKKRNAKLRERWANDPEFRARQSASQKAYRERKKQKARGKKTKKRSA